MSRVWSCFVLEKCLCECGLTSTTMHFVSVGRQSCMQVVSASRQDTETWKPSLETKSGHLHSSLGKYMAHFLKSLNGDGTCLAFASTNRRYLDMWFLFFKFVACPAALPALPLSTYHLILNPSMQPRLVEINNEDDGCRSWLKEREEKKKLIVIPQSDCQGC